MVGVFKKEKPLLFLQGGVSTLFLHPSLCCFMYVDEKLVAIYIKSKKKNLDVLNLNIYLTTTRTTTNTPPRRHQHKAIGSKRGFFHMQMSPFAYLFGGVCFVCCNKEMLLLLAWPILLRESIHFQLISRFAVDSFDETF